MVMASGVGVVVLGAVVGDGGGANSLKRKPSCLALAKTEKVMVCCDESSLHVESFGCIITFHGS